MARAASPQLWWTACVRLQRLWKHKHAYLFGQAVACGQMLLYVMRQ